MVMNIRDASKVHADFISKNWTAQEIAALKEQAEKARTAALQLPPFTISSLESARIFSDKFGKLAAEHLDPNVAGLEYAIELSLLEALQTTRSQALEAVARHLQTAYDHPAVRAEPAAQSVLNSAIDQLKWLATDPELPDAFVAMANDIACSAIAEHAAEKARAKNAEPRAWVRSKWDARTDKGQSKAAFARQYALLVKQRFNVLVQPEHIAREWLPKEPKAQP